jgi:hypothetical protein
MKIELEVDIELPSVPQFFNLIGISNYNAAGNDVTRATARVGQVSDIQLIALAEKWKEALLEKACQQRESK